MMNKISSFLNKLLGRDQLQKQSQERRIEKILSSRPAPIGCGERIVQISDNSGSMDDHDYPPSRLECAKTAIRQFVDLKTNNAPGDEIGIVTFGTDAQIVLRFTSVTKKRFIDNAISSITVNGSTNMGAGFLLAEKLFQQPAPARGIVNRIILLSDGWNNTGKNPLPLAERLKKQGVIIDTIGIGGSPSAVDEKLLKKIASFYDGELRYRFITSAQELFTYYRRIASLIK